MKFREKAKYISTSASNLYVIQECEDPDQVRYPTYSDLFSSHLWKGKNKNKGIGIFATGETTIEAIDIDDTGLELFLPCRTNLGFNVLAVWTKGKTESAPAYIGQFWAYYRRHRDILNNGEWLILGDFNSNAIWNNTYKPGHSFVVAELESDAYQSAYHNITSAGVKHGAEPDPTLYQYRKKERPYHVDYVFHKPSSSFGVENLTIGKYEDWGEISDHMPLTMEIL